VPSVELHYLVCGGSRGIGKEAVLTFLKKRHRVSMVSRTPLQGSLPSELEEKFQWLQCDLESTETFSPVISTLVGKFGKIDRLLLNGGQIERSSFAEASAESFERLMNVNTKGPYFFLQKCLPHFSDPSSEILVSSITARLGLPNVSIYGATKAALSSLARSLAGELLRKNIRIHSVELGAIDTGMAKTGDNAATKERLIPVGRLGSCTEAIDLFEFIFDKGTDYMTGNTFCLDGGMRDFTS
jgi:NAD(P)-dependent dehydrogenase (short-subunit alcohol dehydrogenase family)